MLYITLKGNNFKLSIETVYDIDWIKELKNQGEKDISKYIIGLTYEDENGCIYLSDRSYCKLCRIIKNTINNILLNIMIFLKLIMLDYIYFLV